MEFPFDLISAEDYAQQRASYVPLTDAVRGLIDAAIHTAVDDATLSAGHRTTGTCQRMSTSTLRHADTDARWHGRILQ